MKYVVVAPIGENIEALYEGVKEFSTERIILITPKDQIEQAKEAKRELEKFKIPVQIKQIEGNLWEEMFRVIAEIKKLEKEKTLGQES